MVTAEIELLLNMVWCFVVYCVHLPACWIFCLPRLFSLFVCHSPLQSWTSSIGRVSLESRSWSWTSKSWSWSWSWSWNSESWSWSWSWRSKSWIQVWFYVWNCGALTPVNVHGHSVYNLGRLIMLCAKKNNPGNYSIYRTYILQQSHFKHEIKIHALPYQHVHQLCMFSMINWLVDSRSNMNR